MPEKILIVDKKQSECQLLKDLLEQAGFHCTTSTDADHALRTLAEKSIRLVIADISISGKKGISLSQAIREKHPDACVILLADQTTMERAIMDMQAGAYDVATKHKGLARLPILAERAFEHMSLKSEVNRIHTERQSQYHFDKLISQNETMQRIHEIARQIAESDACAFLQGESGTGKDLLAYTIHHNSSRSQSPFIKIECEALSETLLEDELFGHEKDAAHGRATRKIGGLELVEGGTLYLDEVMYLSPSIKQRLLHIIEHSQFKRIGGTAALKCNARMIFATRKNLDEAVHRCLFDDTLHTRSPFVTIELPPLRQRVEDIPPLTAHFLDVFCARRGCPLMDISPDTLHVLMDYHWPGNIRELKHVIEYAVTVCSNDTIQIMDLPRHIQPPATSIPATFNLDENEKLLLSQALQQTQGNIRQAAALLDISRTTLYSKMRRHGLREHPTKNSR